MLSQRWQPGSLADDVARNPTVFGKLLRREAPVSVLYEDPEYLAFENIKPYAELAGLVIPKRYVPQDPDGLRDANLLREMKRVAFAVLERHAPKALEEDDFWLRCHRPPFSSVDHFHVHCLAPASNLPFWTRLVFQKNTRWAVDLDSLIDRADRAEGKNRSSSS